MTPRVLVMRRMVVPLALLLACVHTAAAEDGFVIKGWTADIRSSDVIRDPSGGMLITFGGYLSGRFTKSQRIDAQGHALWDSAGHSGGGDAVGVRLPATASDGAGGMFRATSDGSSAYLFRFLADGTQPVYGPPAHSAWVLGPSDDDAIDVAETPEGGCYVAYEDANGRQRLQRRAADGSVAAGWSPAGLRIGVAIFARIEPDGAGGCSVLFYDGLSLRLDRFRSDTTHAPGFPVGGIGLTDLSAFIDWFQMVPSGPEHAIVVWREAGPPARVRGVRVSRDGVLDPAWATTGSILVADSASDATAIPDGAGGLHLLWHASGAPRWTRWLASGVPAAGHLASGRLLTPSGASDYSDALPHMLEVPGAAARPGGGLLFAWTRPDGQGRLRWFEPDGTPSLSEPGDGREAPARAAAVADDGAGGAHVFYAAYDPSMGSTGIQHHRVFATGVLPVGAPGALARVELAPPVPNPARGSTRFAITLPDAQQATLTLHDLAGRVVRAHTLQGAGTHVARFDGLERLPAGLYLARLRLGRETRTTRLVLAR